MDWKKLFSRSTRQLVNLVITRLNRFQSPVCSYDPVDIVVFVTNRCNFLCNTCPFKQDSPYSPPSDVPDIPPEIFKTILEHHSGSTMVGLVGGEPLLHPRIESLIRIAVDLKMTVNLSTNGFLLDAEVSRRLLNVLPGFLNISLDAVSASEYRRLRGAGPDVFEKVRHNIRTFAELREKTSSRTKLKLSFVTDTSNVAQISEFARFGRETGADQVFCQNILSYECSEITTGPGALRDTPEMRALLQNLKIPDGIVFIPPKLTPVKDDRNFVRCRHPFRMLSFDGAGNLSPCCVIPPHPRYGNLIEDMSAWHRGPELIKIRENMLSDQSAFSRICLDCWERFSMES